MILSALNFFRRPEEGLLNHWIAFADGFQTSPGEFYTALEGQLGERKVPSMKLSRVELPEGGLLSEKRIYLRMIRERIVFDVGATPFGTGFFFSCRTAEIPLVLNLWQLGATLIILAVAAWLIFKVLGVWYGIMAIVFGTAGGIYVLRNAVAMGLQDLDRTLLNSPVVGNVYQVFFRRETYHRIDSRLCYLQVVPTLVKELAETTTAEKGVQLVTQYELSPVLGDLYRPTAPKSVAAPAPP